MINFLIDNIFIKFGGRIFQQTVDIPMGTNCEPLLADLFVHSYQAEFVQELLRKGETKLAQSFNFTFRYIDEVLYLNNKNFSNFYMPRLKKRDVLWCGNVRPYVRPLTIYLSGP